MEGGSMPGKPGSGGPVPKRSDQRRRRNKAEEGQEVRHSPAGPAPSMPDADPDWHPAAARWYASLAESGQSVYYEASDWAQAFYVAEAMSRNLNSGKFSAQLFQAVSGAMTELLTTEGARRRARLELQREGPVDEDEEASVTALADYKKQLG